MDFTAPIVLENSRVRRRPLETGDFEPPKAVAFDAELWKQTGELAGSTSYHNVAEAGSIGYTWVGTKFQRSGLSRAAQHLLSHAFCQLRHERVELEINARSQKSRAAMARMEATEESSMRNHRITQGERRDLFIFSIIYSEWSGLRQSVFQEYEARG